MIEEVERFEKLLTSYFEIDDLQAIDIIIATAVSHKLNWSEMLWLRVIGASGSGKTELLRTLSQEPYSTTMESITAGSIRRGYVIKKKDGETQQTLLQRLNGKLVITKEFGSMLTKNSDTQNEIFGLLRSVYDGELDADYGSDEGHLNQKTHFDWILGSTPLIDSNRSIEYQLGSRFIDLRWNSPEDRRTAVDKAQINDGNLSTIREKLSESMMDILNIKSSVQKPKLSYISTLANITAALRTPVERDRYKRDIIDIPEIELGTRMGQSLSRVATGLMLIGVKEEDLKPYLIRLVFSSMTAIRSKVIKAWLDGLTVQTEIAARVRVSQSLVSMVTEDINLVIGSAGYQDNSWLNELKG